MKKIFIYITIPLTIGLSQFDLYPVTDFFGGGIGYSPMYISLEEFPAADELQALGLNTNNFSTPFVVHGGEGFAHMTGKWRIGGYAGFGSTSTSTVAKAYVKPTTGDGIGTETIYTGNDAPTIEAKVTLSLGAGSVEYVMPIFQDLEISAGAMMGLGRLNLSIEQSSSLTDWEGIFGYSFGTITEAVDADGNPVLDADGNPTFKYSSSAGSGNAENYTFITENGKITLSDLSGTFFNFQPYVAIKWQLLDRVGLRISAGFNKGTIGQGRWKLNGRNFIANSEEYVFRGTSFRTMIYLGL